MLRMSVLSYKATGNSIELYIGSNTAYVDGGAVTLDSRPFIQNGRTYCPVRFICESLGAKVEWIPDSKEIIIKV